MNNTNLLNLIKSDGFLDLPFWYKEFVHALMVLGQAKNITFIFQKSDYLKGYLDALEDARVIDDSKHLQELVVIAEHFAIGNNVKKVA